MSKNEIYFLYAHNLFYILVLFYFFVIMFGKNCEQNNKKNKIKQEYEINCAHRENKFHFCS